MCKSKIKDWFTCTGIRALETMAQTVIATIGTSVVISDVNWTMVVSASLLAGLLSILTSIGGISKITED